MYHPLFRTADADDRTMILRDLAEGDREDVLFALVSDERLYPHLDAAVDVLIASGSDVNRAAQFMVDAWLERGPSRRGRETVRGALLRLLPRIGEGESGADSPLYRRILLAQFGIEK
jgi:hypothetical protein